MRRSRRKAAIALPLAIAALAASASLATAELTSRGNLFVAFEGGLAPAALPRDSLAPIEVSVGGEIRALSGDRPPSLRRIEIALNRGGRLSSRGLARCRYAEIEATSSRGAMKACRDALVGDGAFTANTSLPEQATFPTDGHILAFNAIQKGREAILAHIYGTDPLPITRIIVFHIRRTKGTYGTVLSAKVPPVANRYGYVKSMTLRFHRNYTFRGKPRSYLSASCAAPRGFTAAVFPFARASMSFDDGRTLRSTLVRSCRVRG